MLEYAYEGVLKTVQNYSIHDDRPYSMNNWPAKRLKIASDSWHISAELFMVSNRLYQVTILRDGSFPAPSVEREFLESFHIMEALKN